MSFVSDLPAIDVDNKFAILESDCTVGNSSVILWKIKHFSLCRIRFNGSECSAKFRFKNQTHYLEAYYEKKMILTVVIHGYAGCNNVREIGKVCLISKNKNQIYPCCFELKASMFGSKICSNHMRIIEKSELLNRKEELLPDDSLTICCKLMEDTMKDNRRTQDVVSYSGLEGLARDLNRFLTTEADSDVDVLVGNVRIRAHSQILSARSPVFAAMFQHDMQERRKGAIRIEDFAISTIQCLLRFIYTGEVPDIQSLSSELLEELYTAADKYAVMELAAICLQAMEANFSEENLMRYATLAAKHDKKMMSDAVVRFVADNLHIVHSDLWKELLKMVPTLAEQVLVKRTKRMI